MIPPITPPIAILKISIASPYIPPPIGNTNILVIPKGIPHKTNSFI